MLIAAVVAYLRHYAAMHPTEWSTKDFEAMSWHDMHVHGLRIVENPGDNGTAELVLDIDYILEWVKSGSSFSFIVAQASLRFHEVFGLRFTLDYAQPSAGMCAFSLAGIERERLTYPTGYASYNWRLPINWPAGEIEFQSTGFIQRLIGQSYTQASQSLSRSQRSSS